MAMSALKNAGYVVDDNDVFNKSNGLQIGELFCNHFKSYPVYKRSEKPSPLGPMVDVLCLKALRTMIKIDIQIEPNDETERFFILESYGANLASLTAKTYELLKGFQVGEKLKQQAEINLENSERQFMATTEILKAMLKGSEE